MKKQDLIEGVEYACYMNPATARSRYRFEKPFRAILVSKSFTEDRPVPSGGWRTGGYDQLKPVSGIAVDTGKKVKIKASLPKRNKDGTFKWSRPTQYGSKHILTHPEETFEYDYVLLKNAGCILQPWAEYEAEQAERKRWDEEHARQRQAEREENAARADEVLNRVNAVVEALRERCGDDAVSRVDQYSWDVKPYEVGIYVPTTDPDEDDINLDGESLMRCVFRGVYKYADGIEAGSKVLSGVEFKVNDESLALLLGITVEV